jgi:hypothetical protein
MQFSNNNNNNPNNNTLCKYKLLAAVLHVFLSQRKQEPNIH